jgi:hypothetical protein
VAFVTLFPQQQRQPGTYRGTAAVAAGTVSIWLRALMNPADFTDTTKSLSLVAERSFDGGATWKPWGQLDWRGDPANTGRFATPPGLVLPCAGAPFTARASVVLTSAMSVGAEAEVA